MLAIVGVAAGAYVCRLYFPKDGSSVRRAIVIPQSEHQVQDEFDWVFAHHTGALFPSEQGLICKGDRLYELWNLGEPPNMKSYYFDLGVQKSICGNKTDAEPGR
jgi:hypothetical protein